MENCINNEAMDLAFILGMLTVLFIMGFFSMLSAVLKWLVNRFR